MTVIDRAGAETSGITITPMSPTVGAEIGAEIGGIDRHRPASTSVAS